MNKSPTQPDCVRYNADNNSVVFAITDDSGAFVGVHEVLLDHNSKEIGRRTIGSPELGHVKFPGKRPRRIYKGEPEDGMKIWSETGNEVWVDVSDVTDIMN